MDLVQRIAIDPGTCSTRLADFETGDIIDEPTLAAVSPDGEIDAVGSEAQQLLSDLPGKYLAVFPVKDGMISDIDVFSFYIQRMMKKLRRGRFMLMPPHACAALPTGLNDMRKSEMRSAIMSAAVRDVVFAEKTLTAAVGADEDVESSRAVLVVSMGAGAAEAAVICMGRAVLSRTIGMGGDGIDACIASQIRRSLGVYIGKGTAEKLKLAAGLGCDLKSMTVCAKNITSGLPLMANVDAAGVSETVRSCLSDSADALRQMLSTLPTELYADVLSRGMLLTGGCSRLKGAAEYFSSALGLAVRADEFPEDSVVKGLLRMSDAFSGRMSIFRHTERDISQP